jgi:hypothetical protein
LGLPNSHLYSDYECFLFDHALWSRANTEEFIDYKRREYDRENNLTVDTDNQTISGEFKRRPGDEEYKSDLWQKYVKAGGKLPETPVAVGGQ